MLAEKSLSVPRSQRSFSVSSVPMAHSGSMRALKAAFAALAMGFSWPAPTWLTQLRSVPYLLPSLASRSHETSIRE